jgi:hypothetical protein
MEYICESKMNDNSLKTRREEVYYCKFLVL